MPVRFRILGPVQIETGGQIVSLPRRRERCLLGVLLLEANRSVSVDRLAELLWDDDPPKRIRGAVQGHISRLRAALATAGVAGDVELVFVGDGYRLAVDLETVDAHQFRILRDRAAVIADPRERLEQLRAAFDLWHGPALADALSDSARDRWYSDLEEQRLDAFEELASASLLLRREREILPELARIVGGNPGRESLVGLHMRALYQAGRRADALDAYSRLRMFLADELGIDPGPALQKLHQTILRDELALPPTPSPADQRPNVAPTTDSVGHVPPRQLPAPPQMFTGRADEVSMLDNVHDSSTVVITAIDGMAGVGKTALAVHVAHRIAHQYADGQVFIDLHGYTRGMAPVEPAEALDYLLRALGVPGTHVPPTLDQRAALYRTVLADRQVLIVLDNAATEAQVAPLLPGSPGCLVLVTSRHRLPDLDHTHTLSLDTLPTADAITLFVRQSKLAGEPPELLAELVELCGRLPLAIRIAAARLRAHPSWRLAHLVHRLRDQQHRLAELEAGRSSVTAALDLSYHHLNHDQRRAYQLLGLHPGPDIDAYATSALLDSAAQHASRLLDQLLDAHLIQEPAPSRFKFHDFTRAHAAELAISNQPPPTQHAALIRLLDYYRHTASVAMDAAYPYEREDRPRVQRSRTAVPDLADPAAALQWLDTELPNLLAAARYATDHHQHVHILHLSTILDRHLRNRGRYDDAEALHQQALETACAAADQTGQLDALIGLGGADLRQGQYAQAADYYGQALQLARATGNRAGTLNALIGLGDADVRRGQYPQAANYYEQALQLARATGKPVGELNALIGLGHIHRLQGRYPQAADHLGQALQLARATGNRDAELNALGSLGQTVRLEGQHPQAANYYEQALQLARATGNPIGELNALTGLGDIHRRQGRYPQAADHVGQALQLARATGNRIGELNALIGLGDIHRRQGRFPEAADHYRQALALAQEAGNRNCEFEVRQGLGRLGYAVGDPASAIAHHQQALALADELDQPADQARAHDGLAHAHYALNQHEQARRHWQHALDVLTRLGGDYTEEEETTIEAIRSHLAALDE